MLALRLGAPPRQGARAQRTPDRWLREVLNALGSSIQVRRLLHAGADAPPLSAATSEAVSDTSSRSSSLPIHFRGCSGASRSPPRTEPPASPAGPRTEPTTPEARAHFDRGGKLFGLQDFEAAILEYKQGALIENLPVFDLALGQCYRKLHRYDDARWHFHRFLKYGRPSGNMLKGVEVLMAQMRAEQTPAVQQSSPPGAPARPLATSTTSRSPATG